MKPSFAYQQRILERLPDLFPMIEILERIDDVTPYTGVFLQEIERMNALAQKLESKQTSTAAPEAGQAPEQQPPALKLVLIIAGVQALEV